MIYMENYHVLWVIFNQLAILYMGKEWAYNEDIVGIQWYIPCIYVIIYIYVYIDTYQTSDIRYCTVGVLTLKGFRLISGSVRKWMDIQNPTKGIKVDASS